MQTKPITHTPTPWNIKGGFLATEIEDVCKLSGTDPKQKANAAFIVKAVNLHDKLLAFVKKYGHGDPMTGHTPNNCEGCDLIAEAEGL